METSGIAVIFDTNSYRKLVVGKTTEETIIAVNSIVKKESQKNIKAFGAIIVGMELMGNLVEGAEGFNYKDCLNGVIAMGNHCFENSRKAPRIFPQANLHISKSFFGKVPATIEQKTKNMGAVINDFVVDFNKAIKHHTDANTFEDIKNYIDKEELAFSNLIMDLIDGAKQEILKKHPKIAKKQLREKLLDYILKGPFEPFIALGIVCAIAMNLGLKLPEDDGIKRALALHLDFPLSVGFYRWIAHEIVFKNLDMQSKTSREKRWNWLWDYHVSFAISHNTLSGRNVLLVTSDKDILNILNEFGYLNQVMELEEYLEFLDEQ